MMFCDAPRPPRQSLADGPSTVFWVAVVAWTVVIKPSLIPKVSWTTRAKGAKQFVVQEALDTISWPAYAPKFTPRTNIGVLSLEGPVNTTFFAPAVMCLRAVSSVKNKPVASTATSTPIAPQLRFAGSRSEVTRIVLPFTTKLPSLTSTVPSKRPWVESYFSM